MTSTVYAQLSLFQYFCSARVYRYTCTYRYSKLLVARNNIWLMFTTFFVFLGKRTTPSVQIVKQYEWFWHIFWLAKKCAKTLSYCVRSVSPAVRSTHPDCVCQQTLLGLSLIIFFFQQLKRYIHFNEPAMIDDTEFADIRLPSRNQHQYTASWFPTARLEESLWVKLLGCIKLSGQRQH